MILHGIFMIIEKSPYLLREMNDLAGYILLHRVLESSLSQLGFHIVKVGLIMRKRIYTWGLSISFYSLG